MRALIVGTGSYSPAKVLTNAELEKLVDTTDQWIVERTGIRERHIAAPEEATSDLALIAARRALEAAGVDPKDLDMIVMVYVLHMLERPLPFLRNLRPYLKPGGSLVIIERNATVERAHFPSFMTTRQILATASEAGFELDRTETFLPRDTIYLYKVRP